MAWRRPEQQGVEVVALDSLETELASGFVEGSEEARATVGRCGRGVPLELGKGSHDSR